MNDSQNTKQTAHTPTPWKFTTEDAEYGTSIITCSDDGYIGEVGAPFVEIAEESKANAAFIVRACNSFDDLVAALQGVVSELEAYDAPSDPMHPQNVRLRNARAALAKCGESNA